METETREESEATAATRKYGRFGIMGRYCASRRDAPIDPNESHTMSRSY